MEEGPRLAHHSRDQSYHSYDPNDAVHDLSPSRAADTSIRPSRVSSPLRASSKQTRPASDGTSLSPFSIKLRRSAAGPSWLPQTKRTRLHSHQVELHQSTCLNLNLASDNSTESDLWILPDFDDWELNSDTPSHAPTKENKDEWAPLLHRAANSNRERLRARLEGDGWAFVGGKYNNGEAETALQKAISHCQDSVDEEFDVVVLSTRAVC
jgi:hypothetical protein